MAAPHTFFNDLIVQRTKVLDQSNLSLDVVVLCVERTWIPVDRFEVLLMKLGCILEVIEVDYRVPILERGSSILLPQLFFI